MAINWHAGDVIRKLREKEKMKQGKLAELADIRKATMCSIEKSGKYDPESLEKIAQALKTSVADILLQVPTDTQKSRDSGLLCSDPEHAEFQVALDSIFHKDEQAKEWIEGNVITFCRALGNPLPGGSKRKNIANDGVMLDAPRTRVPEKSVKKRRFD